MSKKSRKKAGAVILGILLLIGLLGGLLYYNWERFLPKVEEVTYLHIKLGKDTAVVNGGIRIRNRAPFAFTTDSVNYQIRNSGVLLGWGRQLVGQTLPALTDKVIDVRLFLDKDRYRQQLAQQQGHDSLQLEVGMQLYIDPPFLKQQTFTINRTIKTAIPKAPSFGIDTFYVKSFSPDAGYAFQLDLNTGDTDLPDLKVEDLRYSIRLSDSILISGQIDSTLSLEKGEKKISVPIHVETAELIELLSIHLGSKKIWTYRAKASATVKTDHSLFENTAVTVERSGTLDTRKIASGEVAMPSVKRIQTLQLVTKANTSYLQADLLIHNPTKLPLYIDSAQYLVRYKGKLVAHGAGDHEKVLPAKGDKSLQLQLAINNRQYKQIMAHTKQKNEIPLEVELRLHYNLKGSKPQLIAVKEKLTVPVTESPSFEFADIEIKQLDPEQGARLMVKLKVSNPGGTRLQIDDLNYNLQLRNDIAISGKTNQLISIDTGTTEIEIPVDLSRDDVNQVAKGLIQGVEIWSYTFSGTATVSTPNSILHHTEVSLRTRGVYNINSKGTPDYMPEISQIDTVFATIHYDTAWVRMYAGIYNTLPVTINVSKLQIDIIHENDTIGRAEEELDIALVPDKSSFTWHRLGVNYGVWSDHLKHHQGEDSIQLTLPVILIYELADLGRQEVLMDWSTKIPTPATPVTLLQKLKLRGIGLNGLRFDALVAVQNANSEGLTVKDIDYRITLENGVDICGRINRTYEIPIGLSEVKVPLHLSVLEAVKLVKRQFFGPFQLAYKLNATATLSTSNPKLKNVYVIFENHNVTDLKEEKTIKNPPAPKAAGAHSAAKK